MPWTPPDENDPDWEEVKRQEGARAREANQARQERETEEQNFAQSWAPLDLTDAVEGRKDDPPSILARVDGKHIFYRGRVHWLMGEPESMKSWLAQLAVVQVLAEGGRVLYVDYEDTEGAVVDRLLSMGADPAEILERFAYLRPLTPLGDGRDRVTPAQNVFHATLDDGPWDLCILDAVTESMSLEGLDVNSGGEVADWLQRIVRRMERTGAAVGVLDHVTKSNEGRGRYAIGSAHKLAAVTGVSIMVEVVHPLSRADFEPVTGKSRLVVGKDRPGWVRRICTDRKQLGTFEVTAWPDGKISAKVTSEVTEPTPPLEIVSDVMRWLDSAGGEDSQAQLVKMSTFTEAEVIDAIRWLLDKEWIRQFKKGQSTMYALTDKGRKEA